METKTGWYRFGTVNKKCYLINKKCYLINKKCYLIEFKRTRDRRHLYEARATEVARKQFESLLRLGPEMLPGIGVPPGPKAATEYHGHGVCRLGVFILKAPGSSRPLRVCAGAMALSPWKS